MKFNLDGLDVYFPYERIYLEQYEYMRALKQTLDAGGHCLLEMPTGTGKTVCLLSLITSYQLAHPNCGKLVYCTRTVPEMNSVMEELGTVLAYREERLRLDREAEGPASSGAGGDIEEAASSNSNSQQQQQQQQQQQIQQRKRKRIYGPKKNKHGRHNMGPSASPNGAGGSGALALCLSSRRNMCVNERVLRQGDREGIDAACRSMTAPWALERARKAGSAGGRPGAASGQGEEERGGIETCSYYDGFSAAGEATSMPSGVYDLEELKKWGEGRTWCPYYLARRAINHASVLVFNYQYMLDPKVAKMVSKELESESIIVFDEAHNIDSVCIEAFSVTIQSRHLEQATRSLGRLSGEINRVKASDGARLQAEYRDLAFVDVLSYFQHRACRLVSGAMGIMTDYTGTGYSMTSPRRDEIDPIYPAVAADRGGSPGGRHEQDAVGVLARMITTTNLEAKPLLRTLQVPNLDDFDALSDVADVASLVATYSEGQPRFAIIIEPNVEGEQNPGIQLACLDSSLAIAPLFKRFGSVVITSGTLSPIDLYPKLLQFEPCVSQSFNMSTFRPCIRPLVITKGSDQLPVSTKFDDRGDMGVVRNYGTMLVELCGAIPDGVVAFFTSYSYMESIVGEWDGMGIMRQLTKSKLVFIETKDVVETTLALDNFRRACDSGRGAVFLSVARGKVSEGINFDRHYGRAVIMFGVPFQYTLSHILRARLEYLQVQYQIREQDFLNFDALRQASQCVGRVIRSKVDYGLMIFADSRYNRHDKRSKLPKWILQFLGDGQLNLSTDTAIGQVKHFLRIMAQPVDQESLKEVLLTVEEVESMTRSEPTLLIAE
ncbi:hypothetical protein ACHAWF_018562 [Thalassiosira exigua]